MGQEADFVTKLSKELDPPLVTLLSSEVEVQYVALININLIIQKRSDILKNEMKVFFVKYNDPIYIKLVDFFRKSVRAIGRCAIKVEQSRTSSGSTPTNTSSS